MERWEAKILAMCLIFLIMIICGLLPIKVAGAMAKKGEKGALVISVLTCFGGGVFLGAYLMHLSPEVREMLEESLLHPNDIDFPIPEFIIGFGFFLVLCLEKFILYYSAKKAMKKDIGSTVELTGHVAIVNAVNYDTYSHEPTNVLTPIQTTGHVAVVQDTHTHRDSSMSPAPTSTKAGEVNHGCVEASQPSSLNGSKNGAVPSDDATKQKTVAFDNSTVDVEKQALEDAAESARTAQARSIVLILALSLDCLFEGLSLGLMTTTLGVLNMFVAIISHEAVMAFCLGLELIKYYTTKKVVLGVVLYSLSVPLGIAIGMIIYETQEEPSNAIDITNGCLTAIAAGCFIYVTFFGLLGEELRDDSSLAKLLAVIIGFLFMAGMAAIPENDGTEDETIDDFTTAIMTSGP